MNNFKKYCSRNMVKCLWSDSGSTHRKNPDKYSFHRPMTKEESFAQRRKLFKEVWTTANIEADDKNSNRPKVVKTLILKDIERSTDKRKKQKIQNLRTVCQDLLQYCDRQEANFSSAKSPGPKNREESRAEHSRDGKLKPKTKNRSKSRT